MATLTSAGRAKAEGRQGSWRSRFRSAVLAGALVLGFAHSSCAQAPGGGVFERYDRDGDGKVTKAELRNAQTFERFDVNRDGVITQAEYNQVAGGTAAGTAAPAAAPAAGAGQAMQWFAQADRNGDGRLSREEANSPRFAEFDADGDGFVTLDEYKTRVTGAGAGSQTPGAAGAGAAPATPSPMEWSAQTDRARMAA